MFTLFAKWCNQRNLAHHCSISVILKWDFWRCASGHNAENPHLNKDSQNIWSFETVRYVLTLKDPENDLVLGKLISVLHPAAVNSSILLPQVADLQAVIASFKLQVGASCTLGLCPVGPPVLQAILLLSPDSAVDGGVTNKPGSSSLSSSS